jgi:hypothetical protein
MAVWLVRMAVRRVRVGVVVRAVMGMDVLECPVSVPIAAETFVERLAGHPPRG